MATDLALGVTLSVPSLLCWRQSWARGKKGRVDIASGMRCWKKYGGDAGSGWNIEALFPRALVGSMHDLVGRDQRPLVAVAGPNRASD